jgi:hypothetical protein
MKGVDVSCLSAARYFVFGLLSFSFMAMASFPTPTLAATTCPKTIAIISNDIVSDKVTKRLSRLYSSLGCHTEFQPFPGKRGITLFNKGVVDGELIRVHNIGNNYSRPFVRSALPVYSVNMALWTHPDQDRLKGFPIGYVHGIVWQERYAAKRNFKGLQKYYSRDQMFKAYNMGRLSGIVENDETISELKPTPQQAALINSLKLYHYLGSEYAEFMKKLSAAIKP